jgi:hypothetical protein
LFPFDSDSEDQEHTFITDEEIEFMKNSRMKYLGEEYDEETLENLISWISMVKFEYTLIELIMSGLVIGDWDKKEDEPVVILTESLTSQDDSSDKKSVNLLLDDLFGKH